MLTTKSQWISIQPLAPSIREPHIMELLQSLHLDIGQPLDIRVFPPNQNGKDQRFNRCHVKMQNVDEANICIKKLNGFQWKKENNNGKKLVVQRTKHRDKDLISKSRRLQITNLDRTVSEEQLTRYIVNQTEISPISVEIRHHSQCDVPSFALVQMENLERTKRVMQKLRMSSLQGRKMWVQQRGDTKKQKRNAHFRGRKVKKYVDIVHLPSNLKDPDKVAKWCSEYGAVKSVRLLTDEYGYFLRIARVQMASWKGADAVFEGLHEKEINGTGCSITTKYDEISKTLSMSGFPNNASTADIAEFVMENVNVRPLFIKRKALHDMSPRITALVTFANSEDAADCFFHFNKLEGMQFGRWKIDLCEMEPSIEEKRQMRNAMMYGSRVKIENLSPTVTTEILLEHLVEHSIISKPPTKINLEHSVSNSFDDIKTGIAIVQLEGHSDAKSLVKTAFMTILEDRKCWIEMLADRDGGARLAKRRTQMTGNERLSGSPFRGRSKMKGKSRGKLHRKQQKSKKGRVKRK